MSKNSTASGRRRPTTFRETAAEFRGIRNAGDLEDMLESWDDEEIVIEGPKEDYSFKED